MSEAIEVYEKLTSSFWLPTRQPPREQQTFTVAWNHQQRVIDQLREENAELKEMVEGAKLLREKPSRLAWNPNGYWLDGVLMRDIESVFKVLGEKAKGISKDGSNGMD